MGLSAALEIALTTERPRFDVGRGVLIGSVCPSCGTMSWPMRAVCSHCGGTPVHQVDLPKRAQLLSYTKVWVPRPGLATPYTLGQVSFGHGVLLFAHVRGLPDDIRVPVEVKAVIPPSPDDSVTFWFELADR